jgi:hypothetical protein
MNVRGWSSPSGSAQHHTPYLLNEPFAIATQRSLAGGQQLLHHHHRKSDCQQTIEGMELGMSQQVDSPKPESEVPWASAKNVTALQENDWLSG